MYCLVKPPIPSPEDMIHFLCIRIRKTIMADMVMVTTSETTKYVVEISKFGSREVGELTAFSKTIDSAGQGRVSHKCKVDSSI